MCSYGSCCGSGVADGVYLRSVSGRADGDVFRPLGGKQAGREYGPSHGCEVRDSAVAITDRWVGDAEVLCRRSDGWPGVRSVARMRSPGLCRSRPRSRPKTGCPCRLPSAENARSFALGVACFAALRIAGVFTGGMKLFEALGLKGRGRRQDIIAGH